MLEVKDDDFIGQTEQGFNTYTRVLAEETDVVFRSWEDSS